MSINSLSSLDKTAKFLWLFVFISASFLALVATQVVQIQRKTQRATHWVNATHEVINTARQVLYALQDAEFAVHAYLTRPSEAGQQMYRRAYGEVNECLALLDAQTKTNTNANNQVNALHKLIGARSVDIQKLIDLKRSNNNLELNNLLANQPVPDLLEVKQHVDRFVIAQQEALEEHDRALYQQAYRTKLGTIVTAITVFFLVVGVVLVILHDIASRKKAHQAVVELNTKLDQRVQERTQELAAANKKLTVDNLEISWTNQALEHQLRYHQLIINATTDLTFVTTQPLNITRINPAVSAQLGFEPVDLISKSFCTILTDKTLIEKLKQSVYANQSYTTTTKIRTKSQKTLNVQLRLFPLHDQDKVVGSVIALTPINN